MKRRKNIIISAITCMFSICLMMFGVYAAASPTITLSGQVSYTVRDARILVQGATQTDKFATDSDYRTMTYKNTVPTQQDFDTSTLTQSLTGTQYAAWTLGTGTNEADIEDWSEVNLNFEENNNGIKPITLGFQMSNYSNYPVKATVTVTTTSLTNVSVDNATQSVTLSKYTTAPSTKELFVTYTVTDDSQNASGNIAISIVFEKYVQQPTLEGWDVRYNTENTCYIYGYSGTETDILMPTTLEKDGKSYTVTEICGDSSQGGPSGGNNVVKSIVIPSGIKVGGYAFGRWTALESVTLPNDLTSLEYGVFHVCNSLKSVHIPSSVTSISDMAFKDTYDVSGFSELESITVDENNTVYTSANGSNCIIEKASKTLIFGCKNTVIPTGGSVTSIGYCAFCKCTSLTSITIPSSVTSIGSSAFAGCTGLTSITIPSSVTSIGFSAFQYCYRLAEVINLSSLSITVGSSSNGYVGYYAVRVATSGTSAITTTSDGYKFLTGDDGNNYLIDYIGTATELTLPTNGSYAIHSGAFYGYSNLTSVNMLEGVTSIGDSAFQYCYRLAEVINLSSSLSITAGSTDNGYVGNYAVRVATSGTSAITTTSDGYKFLTGDDGNNYLIDYIGTATQLTLPTNGSYKINQYAFYEYSNLTSITIPSSVTSIDFSAFAYCSGLTSVTIPSSVTSIGSSAFEYCSGLTSVTFEGTTPPSIKYEVFYKCSSLTAIYVPSGSVDAYKAVSNLSSYKSKIQAIA